MLLSAGCQSVAKKSEDGGRPLERARFYLDKGLTYAALAAFGLAIEENPKLTEGHLGMGKIYLDRGNYHLAGNAYETAATLDRNSFDAHYFLGLVYQVTDRLEEAIPMYLRALVIRPDSFDANHHLGGAYLQLGRPAAAAPYVDRAAELMPESQTAWANLAATYSLMDYYEQALEAYRIANELGELQPPILLGMAYALIKLEQYERATNVLRTLNRHEPSVLAFERLGYCQFKLYRFEDALASFHSALELEESDTASLNGLGVCHMTLYLQSGKSDRAHRRDAMGAWRKSVSLHPDQPRIIDLITRYQVGVY